MKKLVLKHPPYRLRRTSTDVEFFGNLSDFLEAHYQWKMDSQPYEITDERGALMKDFTPVPIGSLIEGDVSLIQFYDLVEEYAPIVKKLINDQLREEGKYYTEMKLGFYDLNGPTIMYMLFEIARAGDKDLITLLDV